MDNLLTVLRGPYDGEFCVDRPTIERIEFLPASFAGDGEERSPFPSVILDSAVASVNSGKAAVAVAEDRFIRVEKSLGIDDGCHAGIGIVPSVFPGKYASVGNDAFRVCLVCPKMYQVASVAEPLIEYARGKSL